MATLVEIPLKWSYNANDKGKIAKMHSDNLKTLVGNDNRYIDDNVVLYKEQTVGKMYLKK